MTSENKQKQRNEADKAKRPAEIRVNREKDLLSLLFADGTSSSYRTELLRVLSPSAEVQGHSPEQRQTVAGKRDVKISNLEPVGNYALRITFDDGHETGIFSWEYFQELSLEQEARWTSYLQELAEKGLSR